MENLSTIGIFDIPIVGLCTGGIFLAALYAKLAVSVGPIVASNIASYRRSCHRSTGSRDISTAAATHLMAEHAADNGTNDRARDVDLASTIIPNLIAIDPALRLRR